jgi:hypothetical protein
MKRIILSAMVLAFAVAVQAGDTKTAQDTAKDHPSCCSSKVKTSLQAKEGTADTAKGCCGCCNCDQTTCAHEPEGDVARQ